MLVNAIFEFSDSVKPVRKVRVRPEIVTQSCSTLQSDENVTNVQGYANPFPHMFARLPEGMNQLPSAVHRC